MQLSLQMGRQGRQTCGVTDANRKIREKRKENVFLQKKSAIFRPNKPPKKLFIFTCQPKASTYVGTVLKILLVKETSYPCNLASASVFLQAFFGGSGRLVNLAGRPTEFFAR